ncbi:MAG: heme exporter protein CcmD [Pelagibacteraceae bacterium]
MITNLILMNGYGLFVWFSFGITIIACLGLYFRTRKTLKKYEYEFRMELEKFSKEEKQIIIENSKVANQVLISQKNTA